MKPLTKLTDINQLPAQIIVLKVSSNAVYIAAALKASSSLNQFLLF